VPFEEPGASSSGRLSPTSIVGSNGRLAETARDRWHETGSNAEALAEVEAWLAERDRAP
jgi:hypothetical protein